MASSFKLTDTDEVQLAMSEYSHEVKLDGELQQIAAPASVMLETEPAPINRPAHTATRKTWNSAFRKKKGKPQLNPRIKYTQPKTNPVDNVKHLPPMINPPNNQTELQNFSQNIRAVIQNAGLPIHVDDSIGDIWLPPGFEWKVPSVGWIKGPFPLNDQAYFRYDENGKMSNEKGTSGAPSIIMFGRRPGETKQSVIARLQGREQLPDRVPSEMDIPAFDAIGRKIEQFISDTSWHSRVQAAGFASKIFSTLVMPYKTMPVKCLYNYPCMLQITESQDMDLYSYFKGPYTDPQKTHAFIMFIDRYAAMLKTANIAQIDMKMGNVTVNLNDQGDVIQLYFIDLDDDWTWFVPNNNQLKVIYWNTGVIQTLA